VPSSPHFLWVWPTSILSASFLLSDSPLPLLR
jgi:hypothetical protein